MEKIVQEKKVSARVRFMVQDVIDLRKVISIYCFSILIFELSYKKKNMLNLSYLKVGFN